MKKVKIYFSEYCPYCKSVEVLMKKKNISFEKIDVDLNVSLREEMVKASGRTSVPQVFVNDLHLGGCDDVYDLEKKGELDSLIFKN
jgi:glutaredoxin 3